MKVFFYFICFFYSCQVFGQNEAANWYFGFNAGVAFGQTSTRTLYDGKMLSEEGSAVISDRSGNLLFYSNGTTLVNRSHRLLKNSAGLLGDRSSTQNLVIVPQPGNDSLYFVFSIGSQQQVGNGLHYSIVNMNADDGFGEVVQKNIGLLSNCYEKITAVKHCNNRDVWVTVRLWNSDQYYTYLLTDAGVMSSPVISSTGFQVGGNLDNSIGAMKFSSKGNRLAAAFGFGIERVELLDFNNQTGVLSNSIVFKANNSVLPVELNGTYGLDFSPDTKILYVSVINSVDDPATIYQFDISSGNIINILASSRIISRTFDGGVGNIQIATDGKLYVAFQGKKYLGVINNPNVAGVGCDFQLNGIPIDTLGGTHVAKLGLPTFMQSYFNAEFIPLNFKLSNTSCTNLDVVFRINHINSIDSLHWYFGDGAESTLLSLNQSHHYAAPGYYTVKLKIYTSGCSGNTDEIIVKQIWIAGSNNFLGEDKFSCEFRNIVLETNISQVNYLWSDGSTGNSMTVNREGIYWLEIEKNGCTLRDSVILTKIPPPQIDLGNEKPVCTNKSVELDAGILNATYLWSTGESTRAITVNRPGKYQVMVTAGTGCSATDSVQVSWGDCELFIPSAFSPNGDGINDQFGLVSGIINSYFSFRIYNRYGELVFHSTDQFKKWDGRFNHKQVPVGVYPWVLTYTNKNGYTQTEKGTVMLIR